MIRREAKGLENEPVPSLFVLLSFAMGLDRFKKMDVVTALLLSTSAAALDKGALG